ncbi:CatB-related O-acetyltransferase [Carboxylicivirga linearis]|uniref:CatB-related O-acetyltransferase n=1 Tax=Carboxylicivirga linearis TaxID=1628157 RepID=A0ABS5JUG2_9BACT|nr:CatB-related O-acetyltransferase [Carboxylicivirga linearis]MBS2098541.1 CatB-related O-acetyltransferase [Carboxylicivirga linearis]
MMHFIKKWLFNKLKSALLSQNYHSPSTKLTLGEGCKCYGNYFDGNINIGDNSQLLRSELHGTINIGKFCSLNGPNLDIYAGNGSVNIGNFCSIARNVSFQVESHNSQKLTTYLIFKNVFQEENTSEILKRGIINIGHDVWIGSHTVILGNVNVGNGAIIAANSVVNKDVPPFAIVAGSPARIIKYRFDNHIIEQINELEWWQWSLDKLRKHKDLFKDHISKANQLNELK